MKNIVMLLIVLLLSIITFFVKPIVSFLLLIPVWILVIKYFKLEKREKIYLLLFAILIAFLQVIGFNCSKYGKTLLDTVDTFIKIFSLSPMIYFISVFLYKYKFKNNKVNNKNKLLKILFEEKYSLFILALVIFISWVPALIAMYPGNFSYDAGTQIRMIKFNEITKYHPVIHTMFLYCTIFLGKKVFLSYQIGVLIHSILQMIIMAMIFAYTLKYLYSKKMNNKLIIFFLLLYMFLPTHSVFSITTTKDILFSGIFCLVMIELLKLVSNSNLYLENKKNSIKLIILLILLFAFRNNMLYAFLLFGPVFLFIFRKYFKKILLIILFSISIFKIYDITLTKLFKIEDGPKIEMFSFVVQQFARTYNYDKLTNSERKMIEGLYLNDSLKNYNSYISDPVKSNFNSSELLGNKSKYLKLYVNLFKKHPMTFIDSIFNNIYGFFYVSEKLPISNTKTYIEINCLTDKNSTVDRTYDCPNNKGKLYDFYDGLVQKANYQKVPLLNIFMNMAIYLIILIYVVFIIIIKKKYKFLIPLLILLCYMITNILAPVALVRYAYPLFTTFPLIVYIFINKEKHLS